MKKKATKKKPASKSTKKVVKKKPVDRTNKREQLKAKAKAKAKVRTKVSGGSPGSGDMGDIMNSMLEQPKENLAIVAGWYIVYLKPFKSGYTPVGPLMRYIDSSGMSYLSNPKQLKTHVFMITRGKVEQYQEMKLVLAEENEY